MPKRLYKILEIIGVLVILFLLYRLFPFIQWIIRLLSKIVLPFIIAFILAFILEPIVVWLEKKKLSRKLAVSFVVFVIVGLLVVAFRYIIPLFSNQIATLIEHIPDYIQQFKAFIDEINEKMAFHSEGFLLDYGKIEEKVLAFLNAQLASIGSFLQKSFSYIVAFLITPVLAIYFLLDYPKIENYIKEKLLEKGKENVYQSCSEVKQSLRQYIKGVLIVMSILSIASACCFFVIGIDYALLFGIIVGITDIIPYIGPYIGGGIVILFTLATSPSKILFVLISIVILQFLEGNFLVPKIQSKTMHTNPILVLLSVAFFGEIMGIFGMIIAVPMVSIIEIILSHFKISKNRKKM